MKTVRMLALGALTCAALTIGCLSPAAHAAVPNLAGYRFDIDIDDSRWQLKNYSIYTDINVSGQLFNGVRYSKKSSYGLSIGMVSGATFTGTLSNYNAGTTKPVTGTLSQSFNQSLTGAAAISFQTTDGKAIFTGNVKVSFAYGTYFMAGSYTSTEFFSIGPNPFHSSGFLPTSPPY